MRFLFEVGGSLYNHDSLPVLIEITLQEMWDPLKFSCLMYGLSAPSYGPVIVFF